MSICSSRRRAVVIAAVALALPSLSVLAQLTDKPLRIVLPLSAGSTVDAVARTMSNALAKASGQPVIVENLPGAGGVTGTTQLVRAPKDGMTLGMVSNNHVVNPSLYKSMPFDSIKDITPITVIGTSPFVLVVHSSVPAKDLKELIALAKARPGTLNYGSSGNGTVLHLAAELFKSEAGIDIKHIPYKGTGPMMNDLLGGQVQMAFTSTSVAAPHIKTGAIRPIAISTQSRSGLLPDVPTFAEQGLKNYDFGGWIAVIAPAGVPAPIVAKRYSEIKVALASPEVKDWLAAQDFKVVADTPDATLPFFQSELVKHSKLVKESGATVD
jgi:tripartite-type tricarboxylate transporter receptor subunit TctC